ncbi:3'-5' exonuclease [Ectothiorhodospiraceae bacterium 2226]|nr:3'-5' exonuclease [Ectothiorhodospiraceae bacterium 2226]
MKWWPGRLRPRLSEAQRARLDGWRARRARDESAPADAYLVVDLETGGLNLRRDRVLSIGAVPVDAGRLQLGRAMHRVLRQDAPSERENILVHGLGPTQQLAGEPPAECLLDFLELAERRTLVAYHAPFDAAFLTRALRRHLGVRALPNVWLDLARLLPALFPGAPAGQASLDDWLARFGIPALQRHSAHADALAAAQLFLIALNKARSQGLAGAGALCAQAEACDRFPAGGGISGV